MGFVDIHSHVLPGMDDGPKSIEESLRMIEIARRDGISHMVATPHMIDGTTRYSADDIRGSVERLKEQIGGGFELYCGADVRISPDLPERVEKGVIPTLNGTPLVLIELPEYTVPPNLDLLMFRLRSKGFSPVLTHPERHVRLMNDMGALRRLRGMELMLQITAMSITGEFGRAIQQASFGMMKEGLVDFVASDSHDAVFRVPVLSKAYSMTKKKFGSDTAERLFITNPAKILEKDHSKSL